MSTKSRSSRRRNRNVFRRHINIDGVTVEEPFTFSLPNNIDDRNHEINEDGGAGDGCYISCTVNSRRYYGVLVEQNTLKTASELYFKDEAASLDTNRRMMTLRDKMMKQSPQTPLSSAGGKKRPLSPPTLENSANKLSKIRDAFAQKSSNFGMTQPVPLPPTGPPTATAPLSSSTALVAKPTPAATSFGPQYDETRQVLKFRYVDPAKSGENGGPGYRTLLATYANIAAACDDDLEKGQVIYKACQNGGDFVGEYYYHYQVPASTLRVASLAGPGSDRVGLRCSTSMHTFLMNTVLPTWYPLSNTPAQHSKILNMLQMKKTKKGGIDWDDSGHDARKMEIEAMAAPVVSMVPRSNFRVGVLGAGLAGLGACVELLRLAEEEKVNIEVVLIEARDRIGGRVCTDETTFKSDNVHEPFCVDLGAGWIHGIDQNPLTDLAKESGIDFLRHSDEVKMLGGSMKEVDRHVDKTMGDLFDDLLDDAAEECWNRGETTKRNDPRFQKAVRWYASVLSGKNDKNLPGASTSTRPKAVDAPPYRYSPDISIDHAIGIVTKKRKEVLSISKQEQNLLLWNTKNTEYALGANICDLSMKYWDADERHAFKGDHVLLRQGYSQIAQTLFRKCLRHNESGSGQAFQTMLNFDVAKVEYNLRSSTVPYLNMNGRLKHSVELSDSCRVTSREGDRSETFDFLICALPLGVLKDPKMLVFDPQLPAFKRDAIDMVGFGLLNKVYIQFPEVFWRRREGGNREFVRGTPFLGDEQDLFGNASGLNPHHYMFLDVGKIVCPNTGSVDGPAVLMTMISGREAVAAERLSEPEMIKSVMDTLRHLFSDVTVPDPIAFKFTKWGSDPYSRGSYTFLPPGATDQDYQILQSALNGKGDASVLGNQDIMRLFFAGEHTTALHPSMAHGALLSGKRAAKEVIEASAFNSKRDDAILKELDRHIPVTAYRMKHPNDPVECHFCKFPGSSRHSAGALIAFQRGNRQVLVHYNCAVYSPEVEVKDDRWKNVIKAVNRGKQLYCSLCKKNGATIGCDEYQCHRSFHFACCEDTGWNFSTMGKTFLCDNHRSKNNISLAEYDDTSDNPISITYFRSKNPTADIKCSLCGCMGDDAKRGKLMGFQRQWGDKQVLVHVNCAKYSNNVNELGGCYDEDDDVFQNIFEAIARQQHCHACNNNGATVQCANENCNKCYHFTCAMDTPWDFRKNKGEFLCPVHRAAPMTTTPTTFRDTKAANGNQDEIISHNLFMSGGKTAPSPAAMLPHDMMPLGTDQMPTLMPAACPPQSTIVRPLPALNHQQQHNQEADHSNGNDSDSASSSSPHDDKSMLEPFDIDPHTADDEIGRSHIIHKKIHAQRNSLNDPWNIYLSVDRKTLAMTTTLRVHSKGKDGTDCRYGMKKEDIIISINDMKVGSPGLQNIGQVLTLMRGAINLQIEVIRKP